jgi:Phage capsid protein
MSDFSPSLSIPDHFRRQMAAVWNQVVQQRNQRFGTAGVLAPDWRAKEYVWSDLDAINATETTGQRFGDTNPQDLTGGKRKGYKREFKVPVIRDKWDAAWMEGAVLPDSDVIMAMKSGLNRALDDVFIEAAIADGLGGADPYNTPIPVPNGSKVPVNYILGGLGVNSGLTPYKILEAKTRLLQQDVDLDEEQLVLAITPKQQLDLVAFANIQTSDIWSRVVGKWIEDTEAGKMTRLMGCEVIMSNRLKLDVPTDIRTCAVFAKSAFKVSPLHQEMKMDQLPERNHALQIVSYANFGAVRVVDKKTQLIYCDESP